MLVLRAVRFFSCRSTAFLRTDVDTPEPDDKSIITYVSSLYDVLGNSPPQLDQVCPTFFTTVNFVIWWVQLSDRSIDWLIDWLTMNGLIHWFIDWLMMVLQCFLKLCCPAERDSNKYLRRPGRDAPLMDDGDDQPTAWQVSVIRCARDSGEDVTPSFFLFFKPFERCKTEIPDAKKWEKWQVVFNELTGTCSLFFVLSLCWRSVPPSGLMNCQESWTWKIS